MEDKLLQQILEDTMTIERVTDPHKRARFAERYLEQMDVVDDDGRIIGPASRGLIHRVGLRHRTVFVMVVAPDGRLLLQTRGASAGSSPRRLDISVGGHVRAGESDMASSAIREMGEELGVQAERARLRFVAEYNRDSPISSEKLHERNRERRHLFEYCLDDDEYLSLADRFERRTTAHEVDSYDWFAPEQVAEALETSRAADGLGSNFVRWLLDSVRSRHA